MAACFNQQNMQSMSPTCSAYQQPAVATPNYVTTTPQTSNPSENNYIDLQQYSQQQVPAAHSQNIPTGALLDGNSPPLSNLVNTFPINMNPFNSTNHSSTSVIMTHTFNQSQSSIPTAGHGNQSPQGQL